MSYENLFSKQAAIYARYRPRYPESLFEFLLSEVPTRELAWDCGTGNGQVALSLAKDFNSVIATDVSSTQIEHSFPHPRISYRVARAEDSGIAPSSLDLVTVGNALHWFDLARFYQEIRRVLRPAGIIAVFQYGFQRLGPQIDEILLPFEIEFLRDYWADRNQLAMKGYQDLEFPFDRIPTPKLKYSMEWDFEELRGFVSSWSAVQKYQDQNGIHPFTQIETPLLKIWGNAKAKKLVTWDLELYVGRRT